MFDLKMGCGVESACASLHVSDNDALLKWGVAYVSAYGPTGHRESKESRGHIKK